MTENFPIRPSQDQLRLGRRDILKGIDTLGAFLELKFNREWVPYAITCSQCVFPSDRRLGAMGEMNSSRYSPHAINLSYWSLAISTSRCRFTKAPTQSLSVTLPHRRLSSLIWNHIQGPLHKGYGTTQSDQSTRDDASSVITSTNDLGIYRSTKRCNNQAYSCLRSRTMDVNSMCSFGTKAVAFVLHSPAIGGHSSVLQSVSIDETNI